MPKRQDISSIAVIGAGPIVIGQACEFDYSGVQACKALKEEGYRVILINSNPATIMTDPALADATYIEPITADIVARILEKEKPDVLLPTMGGQTALNTALELYDNGTLDRLGIALIGAQPDAIRLAEDRRLFRECIEKMGYVSPKSEIARGLDEAMSALDSVGLPAIIRPSFTLGGTGGGIAYNRDEYLYIVQQGLKASPVNEILIEQSVLGWKEYEMEVIRDKKDNCAIICSIENIDPMGVHTGDSVTVAPALTLTDKEYQIMRRASIDVLRGIGVETGGANVQFAVNPENGQLVIIEMNPRVSRSSALASKATGYPIARIAAKLAVGYTLDELSNDITEVTPASFEPSIDYVVTKIPRFTFEKFPGAERILSTAMKSVGEAMGIGSCFAESLQKALCSLEIGLTGLDDLDLNPDKTREMHPQHILAALSTPRPDRLLVIAQAFRHGFSVEDIHAACSFEPWFLRQIEALIKTEQQIIENGLPQADDRAGWHALKHAGFSDMRLATLSGKSEIEVAALRKQAGILPVFHRVDTCAAEFPSQTAYFYSCYSPAAALAQPQCEALPTNRKKVVILGSGPNRIGQGIEFDYCCVHAAYALEKAGIESIMINCNPETVSTDYDTSDRLYFEPLSFEHVMNIIDSEKQNGEVLGVIVQLGGQTPLKLCEALEKAGVTVLGTAPDVIDLAEDRKRFQKLLQDTGLRQPPNGTATTRDEALAIASEIGYPVIIRPSYVLGGERMRIAYEASQIEEYIDAAAEISGKSPVLIDKYMQHAIEVDVDALCDGEDVHIAGVMEHIEEAGIHSGDSVCTLPPYSLKENVMIDLMDQTITLAKALNIQGLLNIQFVVRESRDPSNLDAYEILVLEVNPRASRTVPFVAKATGVPLPQLATRIMLGEKISHLRREGALPATPLTGHVAVKAPVFPFSRFPGVDVVLGPEMKSTGESMGIDRNFPLAFAKARLAAGSKIPLEGTVFISVKDKDKSRIVPLAAKLQDLGFKIVATGGTAQYLVDAGLRAHKINKVHEGQPHVIDAMINGDICMMLNTTQGPRAVTDSFDLRRGALHNKIPYYTTISGARAAVEAISALKNGQSFGIVPLQDYMKREKDTGRDKAA
ncbi:MAG: carbamoyl-phosphate synthase large subunit [Alphaproteobacteria bacterium]|nr:MAG: carbamoyl-phosphate synthase large subunit [Alphaproteobacteria bacterium]